MTEIDSIMTPKLVKSWMRKSPFHTHIEQLYFRTIIKPMISNQKSFLKSFRHPVPWNVTGRTKEYFFITCKNFPTHLIILLALNDSILIFPLTKSVGASPLNMNESGDSGQLEMRPMIANNLTYIGGL